MEIAESDQIITVDSANTGRTIGSVPSADRFDVDAAVGAARAAFDDPSGWSQWPPTARAQALRRLAHEIDNRSAQIATLVSDQNGMPISLSRVSDAKRPGHTLRYYADLISEAATEEMRPKPGGGRTMVRLVREAWWARWCHGTSPTPRLAEICTSAGGRLHGRAQALG